MKPQKLVDDFTLEITRYRTTKKRSLSDANWSILNQPPAKRQQLKHRSNERSTDSETDISGYTSQTTVESVVQADNIKMHEERKQLMVAMLSSDEGDCTPTCGDTIMLDATYGPKESYGDFSVYKRGEAILLGIGNKSQIRKRSPKRLTSTKSTKQEQINEANESKIKLMRLKKMLKEQYIKVTSTIFMTLANGTTRRLDWFSPVHVCVYQAWSNKYTYLVFTAAGRLRVRSVHIALAKHMIRVFCHFTPSAGAIDTVCIFFRCERILCQHVWCMLG